MFGKYRKCVGTLFYLSSKTRHSRNNITAKAVGTNKMFIGTYT